MPTENFISKTNNSAVSVGHILLCALSRRFKRDGKKVSEDMAGREEGRS